MKHAIFLHMIKIENIVNYLFQYCCLVSGKNNKCNGMFSTFVKIIISKSNKINVWLKIIVSISCFWLIYSNYLYFCVKWYKSFAKSYVLLAWIFEMSKLIIVHLTCLTCMLCIHYNLVYWSRKRKEEKMAGTCRKQIQWYWSGNHLSIDVNFRWNIYEKKNFISTENIWLCVYRTAINQNKPICYRLIFHHK